MRASLFYWTRKMADIVKLKVVLDADNHPVTGPFSADSEVAAGQLNLANVSRNRTTMTGREVAAQVDETEYNALSDAKKSQFLALSSGDDIDPFGFAVNVVKDIFGAGSNTATVLGVARVETVSYATDQDLGFIWAGHVEAARAL